MEIFLPVLAVFLGFLVALIVKANSSKTQLLLSYSGALLLSVTIFEFLPKVYQTYSKATGAFIMLGVLLQLFLEFLSKGAEHGHVHNKNKLHQFPFLLFLSLSLHAFLEGYPIEENTQLLIGVVIHKIPIAMIITSFLLQTQLSKVQIGIFLLIFAAMTPLGSLFQQYAPLSENTEHYFNALVIGIFLHVSTTILFESSRNHQFNASKMGVIILGILTAYFI